MKNETQVLEAQEIISWINSGIEESKKMVTVREIGELKKGQFFRQGDLYVTLGDIKNAVAKMDTLQLVPGNTTGSRHCVVDSPSVEVWESSISPVKISKGRVEKIARFPGPIIIAKTDFSITHPKHGWMSKIKAGIYQTWQQCDYLQQRPVED